MRRRDLNSKVVESVRNERPHCEPAYSMELFPTAADLDEGRTDTLRSASDDHNFPSGAHRRGRLS